MNGRINVDQIADLAGLVTVASENNIGVVSASLSNHRDRVTYQLQLTDDNLTVLRGDMYDCITQLARLTADAAPGARGEGRG